MTATGLGCAFGRGPLLAAVMLVALAPFSMAVADQKKAPTTPAPAAGATAPKAEAPKQAPPGWTVRCDNAGQGLVCKAIQTIVLAKTRQLLLSAAVSKPSGSPDGALLLQLPHGLFNPAGVTVAVDAAKPEMLQIQTCDVKGCYAGMPVKPEQLAAMKTGTKLNVVFEDLKKQKITVPVPLKGFDEAFKKL
jgi:invasion protein IalB